MLIRFALALALVAVTVSGAPRVHAENTNTVRVIVNAKNPVTKLSKQFVADAFLKKRTRWAGDHAIQPVDLKQKHPVRGKFSQAVLGRELAAVRRYWAQLVFSGRGVPPPEVAREDDIVAYVASNAGAIGYVSGAVPLTGVKVVEIQ